jgi:hypothetical protein
MELKTYWKNLVPKQELGNQKEGVVPTKSHSERSEDLAFTKA